MWLARIDAIIPMRRLGLVYIRTSSEGASLQVHPNVAVIRLAVMPDSILVFESMVVFFISSTLLPN